MHKKGKDVRGGVKQEYQYNADEASLLPFLSGRRRSPTVRLIAEAFDKAAEISVAPNRKHLA